MYLHKIDTQIYSDFMYQIFTSRKRTISPEAIALILELTFGHTYYTQSLCHHLFQKGIKKINMEEVYHTLHAILKEYEPYYYQVRNLLTDAQWQMLKALAVETSISQPYNAEFIKKHKLQSSASVKRSLDALLHKELVYCNQAQEQIQYAVYDKFMLHWLIRLPFK